MTVDKAIQIVTKNITKTLADAKAASSDTQPPLNTIDEQAKLAALDMALTETAIRTTPLTLIETTGSTASELKRISKDYYVRVPTEPILGTRLDIDDGLSYAIVYKALVLLWEGYGEYDQRADSIINMYNQSYADYLTNLVAGAVSVGAEAYIRFSSDSVSWHNSLVTGDIYISFKKIDTATWTPAIQFVGSNGRNFDDTLNYVGNAGKVVAVNALENGIELISPPTGGGASTFLALTDTPVAYTPNQVVAVNPTGTGLTLIPPPTSGGVAGANVFGDNVFFDDVNGGVLNLDGSKNNIFYLYPPTNAELHFTLFNDGAGQVPAWWGTTYTFMLVSAGSVAITFDPAQSILGDATVGLGSSSPTTNITMTILKMVYTGYDWYVASKSIITNANG